MNILPAFIVITLVSLSLHVFARTITGSKKDLCDFVVPRTQTSFIYKGVKYFMFISLCKDLRDLPKKYLISENVRVIILKQIESSVYLLASNFGEFHYDNYQVRLEFGSKCEEFSQMELSYSVVVNFECSEEENEPIFEHFSEYNCSFILKWKAPFACFLSEYDSVKNCSLQFGNNVFDMTSLKHPSYHLIQHEDYKIYINFCGPVKSKDCVSPGQVISGCVINENKTFLLEDRFMNKEYLEDRSTILIKYSAPQSITYYVKLVCNYDAYEMKPEVTLTKRRRRLSIIIQTQAICLSDNRCDIYVGDQKYSLPRLTNVQVKDKDAVFLLSPCGPLKPDSMWSGGDSSASLINGTTVMSLGYKRRLAVVKKDVVTLTLTEGSFCPGTRKRAQTVIRFIGSDDESGPFFENKSNECVFSFVWKGPSFRYVLETRGRNCVIKEPNDGKVFDLGVNSENEFEIRHNDMTFRLNLCGEIEKDCNSNRDASVCLLIDDKEVIVGSRSSQMYSFKEGSLVFELWGSECRTNVTSRVNVNVVCQFGVTDRFVLISGGEDSSCVFNFTWYTEKACPKGKQLSCVVKNKNNSVADLNPLRLSSSNYRVPKDNESYFLVNVCGPLWYGPGEMCPFGSGVCLVHKGKNFISIGEINDELSTTDDGEIILIYKSFLFLPSIESSFAWESVIIFICSANDEGPRYTGLKNSQYLFEWKTKFACFNKTNSVEGIKMEDVKLKAKDFFTSTATTSIGNVIKEEQPSEDIKIISNVLVSKDIYEVKEEIIKSTPKMEEVTTLPCVTSNSQRTPIDLGVFAPIHISFNKCFRLYIDVCQKVSCLSSNSSEIFSLGSRTKRPVLDSRGFVTVNYYDNVLCENRLNKSISLLFFCNKNEGTGVPRLKNETACNYTFVWETRVVCPNDELVLDKLNHNVVNKSSNEVVSLKASLKEPIQIQQFSNERFYVDLWSTDGGPCGGNICEEKSNTWVSYGVVNDVIFHDYNHNRIVIELDGGDLCRDSRRYSSKIYLNCTENGIPAPKSDEWIVLRGDCELILESATPCFDFVSIKESHVWAVGFGVVGVLIAFASIAFGLFYISSKRCRKRSNSNEFLLREHRKILEKES